MHYSRINFKIAFTGIMLGAALLFQYLSQFMPLVPSLMDINLSFIFIVPIFFIADYKFGMMALIIRYVLGPAIGKGYIPSELVGHTVLFVASFIFINLLLIAKHFKFIKSRFAIYISAFMIVIISSFIMALLNGVLFVPLYNLAYRHVYEQFMFKGWGGATTYWAIIFAIYITGNLINFGLSAVVLIALIKVRRPHLAK